MWRIKHHSSDGLCAGDESLAVKARQEPQKDSKASVVLPTKAHAQSPKGHLTAWKLKI